MTLNITKLKEKIARLQGQRETLTGTLSRLDDQIHQDQIQQKILVDSQELLGRAAAKSREEIKARIERVVTFTLRTVLGREDYRFEIFFDRKRDRVEVKPILHTATSSGHPLDNNGGGVVDIIAMTLRLIVKLTLGVPGPLIIDEPAKWIAVSHRPQFMRMLHEFSEKTKTQIIMCTHISEYMTGADKTLEVRLVDGESRILNAPAERKRDTH